MYLVGYNFSTKHLKEGEISSSLGNFQGKDTLVIFGYSWGMPFVQEGDIQKVLPEAISKAKKVIFVSSSAVYSGKLFSPYKETDIKKYPKDVFGLADIGLETVLIDECSASNKKLVILRPDLVTDEEYLEIVWKRNSIGKLYGSRLETVCPIPLEYLLEILRKIDKNSSYLNYPVYNIGTRNIDTKSLYSKITHNKPKTCLYYKNTALDCTRAIMDGLIEESKWNENYQ